MEISREQVRFSTHLPRSRPPLPESDLEFSSQTPLRYTTPYLQSPEKLIHYSQYETSPPPTIAEVDLEIEKVTAEILRLEKETLEQPIEREKRTEFFYKDLPQLEASGSAKKKINAFVGSGLLEQKNEEKTKLIKKARDILNSQTNDWDPYKRQAKYFIENPKISRSSNEELGWSMRIVREEVLNKFK